MILLESVYRDAFLHFKIGSNCRGAMLFTGNQGRISTRFFVSEVRLDLKDISLAHVKIITDIAS